MIVVTNQSGIARGLVTEDQYHATSRRLEELLAAEGAHLQAQYHCPHHPEFTGPCDCRKPGTSLYRVAADRFGLDLAASWWVGDRRRDVQPARLLGGRGILLASPAAGGGTDPAPQDPVVTAPDLATAARRILAARRLEA
jgi:histidinol-phosphate phosphatase family protein